MQPQQNPSLVRGLGLAAAISVNIANMIGTGVFLKSRVMTCNVSDAHTVLFVWIFAGLLSMAGALAYSEIAAMMPEAGGDYVFLRRAYGRPVSFIYGWTFFAIAKAGSQAALAVGFAIFLNDAVGGTLQQVFWRGNLLGQTFEIGTLTLFALGAIWLVALINCAAVSVGGHTASLLTVLKIATVLAVAGGCILFARGDWAHLAMSNVGGACEGVAASARGGMAGLGAAMLGALWAYDGWNNVTPLAGEVKNPQRNIPRAFLGGMVIVGTLYVLANTAYYYVLTPTEIANVPATSSVAAEVIKRFLGPTATLVMSIALLISSFGALHASVLANSRIPYAMAKEGLFFKPLAEVSERSRVPIKAIVAQAAWASVVAASGTYDALTDSVIFASWLFYGLTTASLFVFRRTLPDQERPYRAWGYPVVPVLFLLVTGWLIVNTFLATPTQALTGVALMALGVPFYWYWTRAARS
ncbi:amino acid transporter [Bryobacterales bacterium F-183]|nr:amino acid transporter [Bryobacterales bacterium F-183]